MSVERLVEILSGHRFVALTGAGVSTESGIPDYRGPTTRDRAKNPIQHRQFVSDAATRRRYWARSLIGWPKVAAARPNPGHRALADLEGAGVLGGVITQNVDGLHQAAGSRAVVELHGALRRVVCLDCGAVEPRGELQRRLLAENPGFAPADAPMAPDGDAELGAVESFRVVDCSACGGVLKPDVVFFGGSVPRPVVDSAYALLDAAEALLIVGSSLAVFSGFRFVRRARERGIPVTLVNLGPTRADDDASVRVEGRAGEVLPELASALGA